MPFKSYQFPEEHATWFNEQHNIISFLSTSGQYYVQEKQNNVQFA